MSRLSRRAGLSVIWAMVESSSLSLLSFAVLLVLARMLTPEDFGVAAIALSLVQITSGICEVLFHDVIVHRADLSREQLASAHTLTVVLGALLTVVAIAVAPLVEILFALEGLGVVLMATAPAIFFTSISAVPVAYLRRNMDFRSVALRMMCGRLVGGLIAVAVVFAGFGLWSLVLQQVATTAFASLAIFVLGAASWPGFAAPRHSVGLLRFAGTMLVVNLLWGNVAKLFVIGCGFVLPQASVGLVSLAMRIVDTLASFIATAQSRVALSVFSQVFRDTGTVRKAYLAGARLSSYVVAPVFVGLAVVAHDVVITAVGARWIAIVPLVQIFAIAHAIRSLTGLAGTALTATGQPSANLALAMVDLVAAAALLVVLSPLGMLGLAAAWGLRLLVTMPMLAYVLSRYAGLHVSDLLAGAGGAVTATAIMAAAVLPVVDVLAGSPSLLRLAISVAAGAVVYAGAIWLIDPKLYSVPRMLLAGKT
jgi:O-antigen/teichoic acid export membrane protein